MSDSGIITALPRGSTFGSRAGGDEAVRADSLSPRRGPPLLRAGVAPPSPAAPRAVLNATSTFHSSSSRDVGEAIEAAKRAAEFVARATASATGVRW